MSSERRVVAVVGSGLGSVRARRKLHSVMGREVYAFFRACLYYTIVVLCSSLASSSLSQRVFC